MTGWDTSRYLTLFVGEATEHLDALSKELVHLEQNASAPVIDSLFRHAHSVKGMAASMSLDPIAQLAHKLEDLLDAFRSDMSRVDKPLSDLALQAVDFLHSQVKAAAISQPPPDPTALVNALAHAKQKFLKPAAPAVDQAAASPTGPTPSTAAPSPTGSGASPSPATTPAVPTPAPTVAPAPAAAKPAEPPVLTPVVAESTRTALPPPPITSPGVPVAAADSSIPPRLKIILRVSSGSTQPGVRGFLAYKRLSLLGNVFELKPALDEIKAGRFPNGQLSLQLETTAGESELRRTLQAVTDISIESITAIDMSAAPPPAPPPTDAQDSRVVGQEPTRTVRVQADLLDEFLETAGELLLATARVRELSKPIPEQYRSVLDESVDRLHGLVRDLHGKVMKARMTPISVLADRLPRAARDIARRRGRDVEVIIEGADIELDRALVDELADPLLHLLRNGIDHGIEPPEERRMRGKPPRGTVRISVRRLRERVEIDVADDGRGMDGARLKAIAIDRGLITAEDADKLSDKEALLLCCLPGVSTAADVTEISGRGVGMDAVKRAVESVGGALEIESTRGRGTKFRLTLPLTVAMINLLLVRAGGDVFGLPIAKVAGVVEVPRERVQHSQNAEVVHFGDNVLPVHHLNSLLLLPEEPKQALSRAASFVVVETDQGRLGLSVDQLLGQQEVVLKPLSRPLDLVPGIAGVTILGNGRPIFVLDVARLVNT